MPAALPSKLLQMSKEVDPRAAITRALGPAVSEYRVMKDEILVGTLIESEKTAGGIYKPQKTLQESLYQGIVGLVLKKGPWAFRDNPDVGRYWQGENVEVGDWVVFSFSDAWEFHLNGVSVRLVQDQNIRGVVSQPEWVSSRPHIVLE